MRIDSHESCTLYGLVVYDRVARGNDRVAHAAEGKDLHRARLRECGEYLLLVDALTRHVAPTVGLPHRREYHAVGLLLGLSHEYALGRTYLRVHLLLHLDHLLGYGLLGIALHL